MAKRTPTATTTQRPATSKPGSTRTTRTIKNNRGATNARNTARPAKASASAAGPRRAVPERHPELHVRVGGDPEAARQPPAINGIVLPRVVRRRSAFAGWGVYAREAINKNRRIIAYVGQKIAHKESLQREAKYLEHDEIWCFKLNSRWAIDAAVGGNDARFINHACKPNCYTQIIGGVIWIRAGRTIAPGEELTYNYYTEGEAEIPCKCRPGCKGML